MLGLSEAFLRGVEGRVSEETFVAIEEPDIIRDRALAGLPESLTCLAAILPARYQQAQEFLGVAVAAHAQWTFDAVMPGIEYGVVPAAVVASRLGLPGATEHAARILSDKSRLREVTAAAGILNPRSREITGPDDITAFASGGPAVVKPTNRQASLGVQLLDRTGPDEAAAAWETLVTAHEPTEVERPIGSRYLVEERLRGPELSVEVLVDAGEVIFQNITAKSVIPGPHPVELGHTVPAPVEPGTADAHTWRMTALVKATGFDTGILHAEWIVTPDGPALIECAGRCPGDRIMDLIDLAYGTTLRCALLDLLAGGHPCLPGRPGGVSAIRFLSAAPGQVSQIRGVEEAQQLTGVRELNLVVSDGSEIKPWTSSWDRPGYVIITGRDVGEVGQCADAVVATVQILTR